MDCTNLVNAPTIPNSVTDACMAFMNCYSLTNVPDMDGATNLSDLGRTFEYCNHLVKAPVIPSGVTNIITAFARCDSLTGNIIIYSNHITNAGNCFYMTTLDKDVYIPFKYENGVQSATYNAFTAAGYSPTTRKDGAILKDITPLLPSKDYQYTVQGDGTAVLTKYIGTSTKVVGPSKVEGDL